MIQIEPGGFAGFDTHAQHLMRHGIRLAHLGETIAAIDQGPRMMTNRPEVSQLAVSEFGHRIHPGAQTMATLRW